MKDRFIGFTSFFKYNIVALIATSVDFAVFIFLNDIVNLWYVFATLMSVTLGGVTAFFLNRNWVFPNHSKPISIQAVKYMAVWGGSLLLNTLGLYLLVENTACSETLSKLVVAVFVGVTYNFLMSKYFIYK